MPVRPSLPTVGRRDVQSGQRDAYTKRRGDERRAYGQGRVARIAPVQSPACGPRDVVERTGCGDSDVGIGISEGPSHLCSGRTLHKTPALALQWHERARRDPQSFSIAGSASAGAASRPPPRG